MKKIISLMAIVTLLSITFSANAEASVVRGKKYYIKLLKGPCGFNGEVMGKHHTKKEWRAIYRSGEFNEVINKLCPKAPANIDKKKQKHLYHFLSSFASDSGNVPSCR